MGTIISVVDMSLDGYYDRMDEWFDPEDQRRQQMSDELHHAADAVLIGRETYEFLSEFWPKQDGEFADLVNAMPKYVASRTLKGDLDWNSTILDGPIEESVRRLKEQHRLIVSWGFGELGTSLIKAGLLDELRVYLHPFVVGKGDQEFGNSTAFRLHTNEATVLANGSVMISYRPEAL
ncbi:dihydrofolate reductase family protein [Leifsonia poae]|uniref:dihydrofolate reductase family protein n=1 Tax=Leifsonia poae TaxID=110933 RepID=UPI003D66C5A4